ncbi:MAG: ribonuclease [Xanthomonadaceae bacterium]|nr:ribonuclease [Xanthomonadaceae bacterium]
MRNPFAFVLLLIALAGFWWMQHHPATPAGLAGSAALPQVAAASTATSSPAARTPPTSQASLPEFLPPEARITLALIQQGGPYPHRQDGSVFGNFEGHLPRQPRGWYHEYTVDTPGARNRGTRRIITGGNPPREWYYTDDHYASFRRFEVH